MGEIGLPLWPLTSFIRVQNVSDGAVLELAKTDLVLVRRPKTATMKNVISDVMVLMWSF